MMIALALLVLAPPLRAADWTADVPGSAAAVARASSIARAGEIMTTTGVLKPFAEGLDRILTPLRDETGNDILDRGGPVSVIVLDIPDNDARALAFLLPVRDLAKFLSLATDENVSELPGGVYRVGPPGGSALFCARVSSSHIVLAYSQADCARLAGFHDSGEPSLADVLGEEERAMLSRGDVAGLVRGGQAGALLRRFAPGVVDSLPAPRALRGASGDRPPLDWLRSIDRLAWTLTATRAEGTPARNDLALDVRVTPAAESLLAALIAQWQTHDAPPADVAGTAAVVTWNLPLTPKLLEGLERSLRTMYDAVRPVKALAPPELQRDPVQEPASQPSAPAVTASKPASPAQEGVTESEILSARQERDLFLRDTFLLTESVTGAGGAALVPGAGEPRLGLVAWQRVRPWGDLDARKIIAEWVEILKEHFSRDVGEIAVTFETDAGSVAGMDASRIEVGPVNALFFGKDDLFFLGGNPTDAAVAALAGSLEEPPAAGDPPAQVRLTGSLYNAALFAAAGTLSKEDLDMIDRLADVYGVPTAGVSGVLRCTDASAHIELRLRLEDLFLALQVLARARLRP